MKCNNELFRRIQGYKTDRIEGLAKRKSGCKVKRSDLNTSVDDYPPFGNVSS